MKMEQETEFYSFWDVLQLAGFNVSKKNGQKDNIYTDERKNWCIFLGKLNIDENCFKGKGGRWCFDENGKALIVDFLMNKSEENYMAIRRLKYAEKYSEDYRRIIAQAILNLQSIKYSLRNNKKLLKKCPDERRVYMDYWSNLYKYSNENIYCMPWMGYMREYMKKLDTDQLMTIFNDILYVGIEIQEAFDGLEQKFREECDAVAKRWFFYFNLAIHYRLEEHKKMIETEKEGVYELNKLIEELGILDESIKDEISVEKLSEGEAFLKQKEKQLKKERRKCKKLLRKISEDDMLCGAASFSTCEELYDDVTDYIKKFL